MGTSKLTLATKNLYDSSLVLFTIKTLRDILEIEKEATFFSIIKRLQINSILEKIEKNKYKLRAANVSDFALANFIYQPSYVSFETALNFFGVLPQFPYEITSASSKKSLKKGSFRKSLFFHSFKKGAFLGL